MYQSHSHALIDAEAIGAQRRFVTTLRDVVVARIGEGLLSVSEREKVVFLLKAACPFYSSVAGNTPREMLAFDGGLVSEQMRVSARH